jgi:hypothetical protein
MTDQMSLPVALKAVDALIPAYCQLPIASRTGVTIFGMGDEKKGPAR